MTEHIYKSVGHTFQDNPPQNNQQQEYDAEDYIDDEIQEEFWSSLYLFIQIIYSNYQPSFI